MKAARNSWVYWGTSLLVSTLLALSLPSLVPAPWGFVAPSVLSLLLFGMGILWFSKSPPPPLLREETAQLLTPPSKPVLPVERLAEAPDLSPQLGALHYVSQSLHEASIAHIRKVLAPLSDSLFGIKANLHGLLNKSKELENSFRNDSQGLGQTVSRFSTQSGNIQRYAHDMDQSVKKFSNSGTEMESQLMAITEASRQINDVAERIKVLSINASIEAARAGKQGAGFKIISQEVRRLAEDTNLFSQQIDKTITEAIGDTKDVFDQFTAQYYQRAEEMHVILQTTQELEAFVKGLFGMIEGIFRDYDGFVAHLESELENVSPTLQQNEIATQQIENTWRGLQENTRSLFPGISPSGIPPSLSAGDLRLLLETFSKYLTTPLEAEVLRRIADAAGLTLKSAKKESDNDITLF